MGDDAARVVKVTSIGKVRLRRMTTRAASSPKASSPIRRLICTPSLVGLGRSWNHRTMPGCGSGYGSHGSRVAATWGISAHGEWEDRKMKL